MSDLRGPPLEMDPDEAVQSTNDDAQASKASCVQAGYFQDDFIHYFVKKKVRKAPLINRGYYTRHRCMSALIARFRVLCEKGGHGCQLLNLGAGFDTTYWQLKHQSTVLDKFVELDMEEVLLRKVHAVSEKSGLREVLERGNECTFDVSKGRIASAQYHAQPADLRNLQQVETALRESGIDFAKPTIILSECVLVYMKPEESNTLVSLLAKSFATAAIVIYEQIQPDTKFGQQMVRNLEARGAALHGVYATPTLEAHEQRLTRCGFASAFSADLNAVYRKHLDPQDRRRIEALELFDEFEEWHLIMGHYCVAVGVKDEARVLDGFGFDTYEDNVAVAVGLGGAHGVPLPGSGVMRRPPGLPNAD